MRKYLLQIIVFYLILTFNSYSLVEHYKNLNFLKYGLYFNDKLIGQHTFEFKKKDELLYVVGVGNFTVEKLGVLLFDFKTKSEEVYDKGQLINYSSKTTQNKKEKYSNIKFANDSLIIDGSSFKGTAKKNLIVGTWWNHEIVQIGKQISPISGRLLPQKVSFLGKKDIKINNKSYRALHFNFLSDDDVSIDKKKLNINIWYDEESLLWIKSSYNKFGLWEYRLLEVE